MTLSNRLLERSLFASVSQAVELRRRGWRAKGSTCEACGRRVWGPGVHGNIYEAWEEKQERDRQRRAERKALLAQASGTSEARSKGKENESGHADEYSGNGKAKGKGSEGTARRDFQPVPEQVGGGHGGEEQDGHVGMRPRTVNRMEPPLWDHWWFLPAGISIIGTASKRCRRRTN